MTTQNEPASVVSIRDFSGLVLDTDRHDLSEGQGDRQVNATSGERGKLISRRGVTVVQFEGE